MAYRILVKFLLLSVFLFLVFLKNLCKNLLLENIFAIYYGLFLALKLSYIGLSWEMLVAGLAIFVVCTVILFVCLLIFLNILKENNILLVIEWFGCT